MARKSKKNTLENNNQGIRLISKNKRAHYDYEITEKLEAGLVLLGSEVKSLRAGHVVLRDSYVQFRQSELYLVGCQIREYEWANQQNHEPMRERKLLVHKRELHKLNKSVHHKGLSLIPTQLYFKNSKIKLEFGVGKGKKQYEKRDSKSEQQAKRDIERAMKQR